MNYKDKCEYTSHRERVRDMFLDFFKAAKKADLFEDTDKKTLKELNDFIEKWVDNHFPFPFDDED